MAERFDSIYSHGLIRAAVCLPSLRVADPAFNVERTVALARQASKANVAVALFPELGISAYTNDDLFHQTAPASISVHDFGGRCLPPAWAWLVHGVGMARACLVQGGSRKHRK